jgi:hypothetical protein
MPWHSWVAQPKRQLGAVKWPRFRRTMTPTGVVLKAAEQEALDVLVVEQLISEPYQQLAARRSHSPASSAEPVLTSCRITHTAGN